MMLRTLSTILGALALAACAAPPQQSTYDAIRQELASATKPAAPGPVDEQVARALLPSVTTLAADMPKARQALEERFNVAFNNVPAQQFFHSLVAGTRYNMLVAPEITGNITANLKDVTMVEALDAIRELYGYEYKIDGTRIYIRPLSMQTRMFRVNYLIGQRNGQSNLRVSSTSVANAGSTGTGTSGTGGLGNGNLNNLNNQQNLGNPNNPQGGQMGLLDSANVNTTTRSDFWGELKESLEALIGSKEGGRSVVISPQSGVIVVRGMPAELRNVEQYLKATQLAVERQVILEAKILEVELNDSFQSGINWSSFASFRSGHDNRVSMGMIGPGTNLAPLPFAGGQPPPISNGTLTASTGFSLANAAATGGSLFGLAFQTSNFAALISFLESQGTVHVLSSPRVAATNNQKAILKIGTDEFFVTGVSTTTANNSAGSTTTPNVQLQPFFSGVVLDVMPQIDEEGNILLHVHPSVSQVTTVTKGINLGSAGSLTLPLASSSTAEMDTMVRGQDGKVVAIGGLMRQSAHGDVSQLPGAGDIPVLGALFRSKSQVNQKRELVVLIKPTIVDASSEWNADLLEAGRRIDQLAPRTERR